VELRTKINFKPSKILLHKKNCDNNQNTCLTVDFCVTYNGKHIQKSQPAVITIEITDSKLRVKENRVKINKIKNFEQKDIQLKANGSNCFVDSFVLTVNVSAIKKYNFILFLIKFSICRDLRV
jgi:hypothetical protein